MAESMWRRPEGPSTTSQWLRGFVGGPDGLVPIWDVVAGGHLLVTYGTSLVAIWCGGPCSDGERRNHAQEG